jgi:hypothetical protein
MPGVLDLPLGGIVRSLVAIHNEGQGDWEIEKWQPILFCLFTGLIRTGTQIILGSPIALANLINLKRMKMDSDKGLTSDKIKTFFTHDITFGLEQLLENLYKSFPQDVPGTGEWRQCALQLLDEQAGGADHCSEYSGWGLAQLY